MAQSGLSRVAGPLAGPIAAAVALAVCVALVGCSATGNRVDPRPTVVTQTLPPILGEAWWRTDLPADGAFESLGAPTTGDVSVVRDGLASIRITITGFSVDDGADPDLRVQLAGGDVTTRADTAVYVPAGDPVEVGSIALPSGTIVIEFRNPQILPLEIHSLVLVDYTTDTQLAAAELVPSG